MIRAAYSMPAAENGVRVLAAREWPSGCGQDSFEVWAPELAPSGSLLRRRRDGMPDDEFLRAYRAELCGERARRALAGLRRLSAEYGVVLCYGPEGRLYHGMLARIACESR